MLTVFLSLGIGVVMMRMYALYEQSRRVLALYITVAALILVVVFVGLNFSGIKAWPHILLLILLYIVGNADWKKRRPSEHSDTHRLRCSVESRKVRTSL